MGMNWFLEDLKDGSADQMCSELIPEDCASCVSPSDCKGTKIDAFARTQSFVLGTDDPLLLSLSRSRCLTAVRDAALHYFGISLLQPFSTVKLAFQPSS